MKLDVMKMKHIIQRTEDVSIVRSDFNSQYQIDERIKDIELIKNYLEKENTLYN
jgi:hypothetical protein